MYCNCAHWLVRFPETFDVIVTSTMNGDLVSPRVRACLRQRDTAPTGRLTGHWEDERSGHVHAFDPAQRRFAQLESFDLLRYSMLVPGRPEDVDGQRAGEQEQPGRRGSELC